MFVLYGFYDEAGKLIEAIPSNDIEEAKRYFNENYPDKEYFYIGVIE